MHYDVVIVGGGPAGLAAALTLGRARARVLQCDAGPRRNAAAVRIHGFVTRDGTPPSEFRRIAAEEIAPYDSVEVRSERVEGITGESGNFQVQVGDARVHARRLLVCAGMIDVLPDLPGYRELWGKAIFQCPYCHGWEVRDKTFGFIAPSPDAMEFGMLLRRWTRDVVVFTDDRFAVPPELRERLAAAQVGIEGRRIRRIAARSDHIDAIEMEDGGRVARDVLFVRPPQHQTPLVLALGLQLDEQGYVRVDDERQTSRPGIYAAGDLTSPAQSALMAAGAGMFAAARLNHALTIELAASGQLP